MGALCALVNIGARCAGSSKSGEADTCKRTRGIHTPGVCTAVVSTVGAFVNVGTGKTVALVALVTCAGEGREGARSVGVGAGSLRVAGVGALGALVDIADVERGAGGVNEMGAGVAEEELGKLLLADLDNLLARDNALRRAVAARLGLGLAVSTGAAVGDLADIDLGAAVLLGSGLGLGALGARLGALGTRLGPLTGGGRGGRALSTTGTAATATEGLELGRVGGGRYILGCSGERHEGGKRQNVDSQLHVAFRNNITQCVLYFFGRMSIL